MSNTHFIDAVHILLLFKIIIFLSCIQIHYCKGYTFTVHLLAGVTPSSSTGQFTPVNSMSPSHSSSHFSPEKSYQTSSTSGEGGRDVSWTIGGAEGGDNRVPTDSVNLEAGRSCKLHGCDRMG